MCLTALTGSYKARYWLEEFQQGTLHLKKLSEAKLWCGWLRFWPTVWPIIISQDFWEIAETLTSWIRQKLIKVKFRKKVKKILYVHTRRTYRAITVQYSECSNVGAAATYRKYQFHVIARSSRAVYRFYPEYSIEYHKNGLKPQGFWDGGVFPGKRMMKILRRFGYIACVVAWLFKYKYFTLYAKSIKSPQQNWWERLTLL